MFEVFVTGPIGIDGGLARRCVLCRGRAGQHAAGCAGFGDGCLSRRSDAPEAQAPPAALAATPTADKK